MKKIKTQDLKQAAFYVLPIIAGVSLFCYLLHFFLGVKPSYIEIAAVMANILGLTLIRKQNIIGWISFLVCVILLGIFSLMSGVYGGAIMQFGFFVPSSIYAFYAWLTKTEKLKSPTALTPKEWMKTAALLTAIFLFIFFVTEHKTPLLHWCDTLTTSLMITGQVLIIFKKKEGWLLLIPANTLSGILFYMVSGYLIMALSFYNTGNSLIGYIQWRKKKPLTQKGKKLQ